MCYNELMVKKGDTLIEVTLAVGIFSMVAVSIVTVLSNDTSDAQTALETTLAREEINTQAEVLRFIQSAYIAGRDSTDDTSKLYNNLWKEITGRAVNTGDYDISDEELASYTNYSPISCAELYDDNSQVSKGFVINPRILSSGINNPEDIEKIVISNKEIQSEPPLIQAVTYPRLIYDGDTNASLVSENNNTNNLLNKAEGIYIIAVKDAKTTQINGEDTAAFYDFYIRTCWYASNADQPLTVSTVIRLYDPEALPAIIVKPKPFCNNNTMQCFDPSRATSDTLSLKDVRDDNVYTVAKIGNLWWMTQNLNLAGGTVLTSELSNVSQDYTLPASSNSAPFKSGVFNAGGELCSSGSPCYSYYNYITATAGTNSESDDICPKGWRLPDKSELTALARTYTSGNDLVGGPFAGVYSGSYGLNNRLSYELKNGGSYGFYWSSTTYEKNNDTAYLLYFYNDHTQIATYQKKITGASIRCIKKP